MSSRECQELGYRLAEATGRFHIGVRQAKRVDFAPKVVESGWKSMEMLGFQRTFRAWHGFQVTFRGDFSGQVPTWVVGVWLAVWSHAKRT